jgi:hypothetical protein
MHTIPFHISVRGQWRVDHASLTVGTTIGRKEEERAASMAKQSWSMSHGRVVNLNDIVTDRFCQVRLCTLIFHFTFPISCVHV